MNININIPTDFSSLSDKELKTTEQRIFELINNGFEHTRDEIDNIYGTSVHVSGFEAAKILNYDKCIDEMIKRELI